MWKGFWKEAQLSLLSGLIFYVICPLSLTAFDDHVDKEKQDAAHEDEHEPIRRVTHRDIPYDEKRKIKKPLSSKR